MPAVEAARQVENVGQGGAQATLGDVIYAKSKALESEASWVGLVRSIAGGDQHALHALYERANRPVFTLLMRITSNRESAEELTLDVFYGVWRRASGYDPVNGTVLGWIMNQARSRALDRLRFEGRKKRVDPGQDDGMRTAEIAHECDVVELKQQRQALVAAMAILTPDERHAIESAYFSGLTYAEVAARLDEPLGTVKTRIRSGLHKLRQALGDRP
jgi:RNA polymerase sigma-70 factor, ECF subfamily